MASRLTFRERQSDVAWQRQLRDRFNDEGAPDLPHLDVGKAEVRPIGARLARQIILKYEWLGTMANTSYHYGIFFGPYCAGVTCLGHSCHGGSKAHQMFNIDRKGYLVLARGACVHWAPTGTNSKLVSWTCRLLTRARIGKVVIAYADSDAGEIGTIYQACNWTYIGRTGKGTQWVAPNGRVFDARYPSNRAQIEGGTRAQWAKALRNQGWREQANNPKHRYVSILDRSDKALVKLVESLRRPYPKRVGSIAGDAPLPAEEGGSSPTPTLHSQLPVEVCHGGG